MTRDDDGIRELEHDERWLRGVDGDALSGVDLEGLKRRVRIEVHEQWLSPHWAVDVPPMLIDRIKRRIRAEISGVLPGGGRQHGPGVGDRRVRRVAVAVRIGALAMAASIVALVTVLSRPSVKREFSEVAVFTAFVDDELSCSIRALREDVSELELAMYFEDSGEIEDAYYEDVLRAIRRLGTEDNITDDWS